MSTTPVANNGNNIRLHLELRIFPRISEKIRNGLMGYSGAWGKLIREKKPEAENLTELSLKIVYSCI